MATYKIGSNATVFEVDGVDLTKDVRSINWTVDNEALDVSVLTQPGKRTEAGQATINLAFSAMSQASSGCSDKVTSANLSVLTVGGTNYLTTFRTMTVSMNVNSDDVSAGNAAFKSFQPVTFDFDIDLEVMVPAAATHPFWTASFTASATQQAVFSFTLNGTVFTIPCTVVNYEYASEQDTVNIMRLQLKGFPPCTGDYPTAPTSGTGLIVGFMVDPLGEVNVEYQSAASNGELIDVNMVLQSMSFSVDKGQIVETSYNLVGTGTPALTIS